MLEPIKDTIRDLRLPHPPFWLVAAGLIFVVATWVPLAHILLSRTDRSPLPPIHIFQDMDHQPKYKNQSANPIFIDGRSMRPVIAGTIARGEILGDEHYTRGYAVDPDGGPEGQPAARYYEGFPDRVRVDLALLDRGQERFNIMCAPCHGLDGRGEGRVNVRALQLVASSAMIQEMPRTEWAQVANLLEVLAEGENAGEMRIGPALYPEGKLFNTITHGFGNMAPLGSQIPIDDRWAIVAYVRALQASGGDDVVTETAQPDVDAPRPAVEASNRGS